MRVLITGGAGFIGSHLVEHFQGLAEVRVVDDLRTGKLANLAPFEVDFHQGSILDMALLQKAMAGVDYVFHLAAMVSVPESMLAPDECVRINTQGTLNVLRAAAAAGVRKVCFSSSCALYGDDPVLPKRESMLPCPKSPYAITKLSGEYFCQVMGTDNGLPTACLRYFNVYGPRQDPLSQYAAAIPAFITRALNGQDLTIYGDGEQTRDFVYVKDIVAANVYLATSSSATGVFNVASGRAVNVNFLAKRIAELAGTGVAIHHTDERAGDVKHSAAATDKLDGVGFKATMNLEDGLATTVESFRQRLAEERGKVSNL